MGRAGTVLLALGTSAVIVTAVGCAEKFVAPDKPDLYKVPYDFAPASSFVDLASHDLGDEDLSASHHDDLAHEEHD